MGCRRNDCPSPSVRDGEGKRGEAPCGPGRGSPRKHDCPDCRFCQFCSDTRCRPCRAKTGEKERAGLEKLGFSEQIQLYDSINKDDPLIGKKC